MASGDVQNVVEEPEELVAANDPEQPADSDRPQPHFTFPRELRDRIYAYLLHHDHVREEPYHTRKQSARGKVSTGCRCRHDAQR